MSIGSTKLIILDRDGVINEDRDDYVKSSDEWIPLPGSLEAIALLNQAGYHIAVATNQSGLARGLFNINDLHAMHSK
ncbi:MAG: D-glycero-beta-D-manno-heptose-1,7-bisphosphate 7-phosphatase, partial [Polynucleobacter sp. 35-46-207]